MRDLGEAEPRTGLQSLPGHRERAAPDGGVDARGGDRRLLLGERRAPEAPAESAGPAPDGTVGFLHLDMDAFYASVEQRRHPELRGHPVVVGGTGRRGVVASASYEARAHGIRSAMPSARAARLCPRAVFLPCDIRHYAEASERIMAILHDVTPLVEPLSLDEAFCDVRGVFRLHGPAPAIAAGIRQRVLDSEQLTCSVGVASSKLLAKIATERAKPRIELSGPAPGSGVHVVDAGGERDFLRPLPVDALPGVGPSTARRMADMGVSTIGDLAALPGEVLSDALGSRSGWALRRLARGIDGRPVVTSRSQRSVSRERTFASDLRSQDEMRTAVAGLADAVARRLRARGLSARTVAVKIRYGDFTAVGRSATLPAPVDSSREVITAATGLLGRADLAGSVRLLGVSCTGLAPAAAGRAEQLSFGFGDGGRPDDGRWLLTEGVLDEIRSRFGPASVFPAAQAESDAGGGAI